MAVDKTWRVNFSHLFLGIAAYLIVFGFVIVQLSDDDTDLVEIVDYFDFFSTNHTSNCQHSTQGAHFVVDDRGYICRKGDELLNDGCCPDHDDFFHFSCMTCSYLKHEISPSVPQYLSSEWKLCCKYYEICVSCCMKPPVKLKKQPNEEDGYKNYPIELLNDGDIYGYCSAVCRTSSAVIAEDNYYQHDLKYCYA